MPISRTSRQNSPWRDSNWGYIPGISLRNLIFSRIFGGTRINFPVGEPTLAIPRTGEGVPQLVPTPTGAGPNEVPAPIDRRDKPLDEEHVRMPNPTLTATSPEQYAKLKALYPDNPVVFVPGPAPIQQPTQTPGGQDMDLGTLATDLIRQAGTAYINQQFGTAPVPQVTPALNFDVPFVDVIPEAPTMSGGGHCGGASPVYKKVCGSYKWVTPKRRRRKRLATQSDLKDLAALKGILGNGKAFEVWIATHG